MPLATMSATYSAEKLVEIITDFYEFLATLHLDPAELEYPPPGGWPNVINNNGGRWKHKDVIYIMSHIPCFTGPEATVHYKSKLIDYSTVDMDELKEDMASSAWSTTFESSEGEERSPRYFFYIALGRESEGCQMLVNIKDGEVIEESLGYSEEGPMDIQDYFEDLKLKYRDMWLISCRGYITLEPKDVEAREENIDEEEVLSQTESWGTDLDIHYIRQIYREHGWPDKFRRADTEAAVNSHMERCQERRGETWERSD